MRGEPVDLGTIASSGPRAIAAAELVDGATRAAHAVLRDGGGLALAFVLVAAVTRNMPADQAADALALAALRLAAR